jgi:beta-glucosidase-like glycosyl hydrolase
MDAISKRYSLEQAAVLAINAGVDIITCVGDISNQRAFHAGLTMAIENGEIPMKRLDNAVDRVLTMKSRLNLLNTTVY